MLATQIFGMHWIDAAVLAAYLIGITLLGLWMARRVHSTADFFMPRRFGKAMMIMHGFGTGTHSDQAVNVAAKTYNVGLSGIWYQWLWLFATPLYWLIAPVMRRFRATTTGDVFAARFGPSVAMLFAVIGMFDLMVKLGTMLKASSAVIASSTALNEHVAVAAMTALFLIYGMAGGLAAAIVTDFIQGLLTIVFSFLLLPFVLNAVGGLAGIRETVPDPDRMFSLVAPGGIGVFYIAIIALNALVGIVTQPHTMGNCAAGRTEMDGRVGFMVGSLIKRLCTVAWCLTGLAAVAYFIQRDTSVEADAVYGLMAKTFLAVVPGLLGIFLAALLASVMSSCDSFMLASSALFTENVYRPLAKGRSERHYLMVGRITALVVVAGGVVFAYWVRDVIDALEIFWKISPMMGIAFWLGLFWRRTTVAGAWAATLAALGAWWLSTQAFFLVPLQSVSPWAAPPFVVDKGGSLEMFLPWQMVFYLTVGFAACILVSLLTKPVAKEKLDRFYELARTPVVSEEAISQPCTLPAGVTPAPRRVLLPNSGLEIPIPSWTSILGFLAGCAAVAGIIYGFIAIVAS